jgi:hypothetical protein
MKQVNLSECQNQAKAGREANIHKASFIERRLFYLNRISLIPSPSPEWEGSPLSFWARDKGTQ